MSKLYTAKELAEIFGVHPQTIYRAGERGEIAQYNIGRSVRFEMPKERGKTLGLQDRTESQSQSS